MSDTVQVVYQDLVITYGDAILTADGEALEIATQ